MASSSFRTSSQDLPVQSSADEVFEDLFPRPLPQTFRFSSRDFSKDSLSQPSVTTCFSASHDLLSGPPLRTSFGTSHDFLLRPPPTASFAGHERPKLTTVTRMAVFRRFRGPPFHDCWSTLHTAQTGGSKSTVASPIPVTVDTCDTCTRQRDTR